MTLGKNLNRAMTRMSLLALLVGSASVSLSSCYNRDLRKQSRSLNDPIIKKVDNLKELRDKLVDVVKEESYGDMSYIDDLSDEARDYFMRSLNDEKIRWGYMNGARAAVDRELNILWRDPVVQEARRDEKDINDVYSSLDNLGVRLLPYGAIGLIGSFAFYLSRQDD